MIFLGVLWCRRVKDQVLSIQQPRSLLLHRFDPWTGNVHMTRRNKKKKMFFSIQSSCWLPDFYPKSSHSSFLHMKTSHCSWRLVDLQRNNNVGLTWFSTYKVIVTVLTHFLINHFLISDLIKACCPCTWVQDIKRSFRALLIFKLQFII